MMIFIGALERKKRLGETTDYAITVVIQTFNFSHPHRSITFSFRIRRQNGWERAPDNVFRDRFYCLAVHQKTRYRLSSAKTSGALPIRATVILQLQVSSQTGSNFISLLEMQHIIFVVLTTINKTTRNTSHFEIEFFTLGLT